jgi:type IV pilus assembly protein PilE
MRRKSQGFTMIEMMITVLIIGILARVAYTSYFSQVQKSNRSDAKIVLNDVAQRMQRCFTSQSTYKPTTTGTCTVVDNLTSTAGIISLQGYYRVGLAVSTDLTATTYKLTATAVAGKRQETDKICASMTLDQTGKKSSLDDASTDTTATCW